MIPEIWTPMLALWARALLLALIVFGVDYAVSRYRSRQHRRQTREASVVRLPRVMNPDAPSPTPTPLAVDPAAFAEKEQATPNPVITLEPHRKIEKHAA